MNQGPDAAKKRFCYNSFSGICKYFFRYFFLLVSGLLFCRERILPLKKNDGLVKSASRGGWESENIELEFTVRRNRVSYDSDKKGGLWL